MRSPNQPGTAHIYTSTQIFMGMTEFSLCNIWSNAKYEILFHSSASCSLYYHDIFATVSSPDRNLDFEEWPDTQTIRYILFP